MTGLSLHAGGAGKAKAAEGRFVGRLEAPMGRLTRVISRLVILVQPGPAQPSSKTEYSPALRPMSLQDRSGHLSACETPWNLGKGRRHLRPPRNESCPIHFYGPAPRRDPSLHAALRHPPASGTEDKILQYPGRAPRFAPPPLRTGRV